MPKAKTATEDGPTEAQALFSTATTAAAHIGPKHAKQPKELQIDQGKSKRVLYGQGVGPLANLVDSLEDQSKGEPQIRQPEQNR